MFNKVTDFLFKYRNWILLVIAIIMAICIVGTVFLVLDEDKINSDMVSYLSDDSDTKEGIQFLSSNFNIRGYATFVVRVDENDPANLEKLSNTIDDIYDIKVGGLTPVSTITWYNSISSYDTLDESINDLIGVIAENQDYLRDVTEIIKNNKLYDKVDQVITLLDIAQYYNIQFIDTNTMQSYLKRATSESGVYDYTVLIMMNIAAGTYEYDLLDAIKAKFDYTDYAVSGTTETAEQLLNETMKDLPWFIIAGVAIVFIILLITTKSFIEPLILLASLIVGIIVSMGINYLFPSISIISFAISSVLQLAITMDYAIFYMHTFRKNVVELDPETATKKSIPESATSILASALTTIGGFAALYCMKFEIGTDIANVLIKGIATSMISVLLLQPILYFISYGAIKKTEHTFIQKFTDKLNAKREIDNKKKVELTKGTIAKPIARFSVWARIFIIVIAVGLLVPAFLGQYNVEYSYLELYEKKNETDEEKLANELGNQLILAVPVETKYKTQQDFIDSVKKINPDRITGMLGAFTAVNIREDILIALLEVTSNGTTSIDSLKDILTNDAYADQIAEYGITNPELLASIIEEISDITNGIEVSTLEQYFQKLNGTWYTLYTISFNGNTEDREAQDTYAKILTYCDAYFGEDAYYPLGMITSSYEMGQITPRDFLIVTIVSICIIFVIVSILLRNPLKSLLIIIIIELGIWINIAFNYIFGQTINFVVYIIISSVQLGCTVDYAILFANTFEHKRKEYSTGKECAIATLTETLPPILISAAMIGFVCLSMYLISSNLIIKQLTSMLSRGALISLILVTFVQTAVWSFFKTPFKEHNYEEKIKVLQEKEQANKDASNGLVVETKPKKEPKKKLTAEEKLALLKQKEEELKNKD